MSPTPHNVNHPAAIADIRADLLARVGDSEELLQEIIQLFLEDSPRQLEAIRQATANADAGGIYQAAHAFKGSAGNFNGEALVALLQRLEGAASTGDVEAATTMVGPLEDEAKTLMALLETIDLQSRVIKT